MRIGNLEIIFLNFLVSRLTGNLIWCILHVSLLLFQILQGEKMSKLTPVFRHSQLLMNRIVKLQPMQTSRAYYRIDDEIRKINKRLAKILVNMERDGNKLSRNYQPTTFFGYRGNYSPPIK